MILIKFFIKVAYAAELFFLYFFFLLCQRQHFLFSQLIISVARSFRFVQNFFIESLSLWNHVCFCYYPMSSVWIINIQTSCVCLILMRKIFWIVTTQENFFKKTLCDHIGKNRIFIDLWFWVNVIVLFHSSGSCSITLQ